MDEEQRAQFWATLALRHARGVGPRSIVRLLRYFGSAYVAFQNLDSWSAAGVGRDKAASVATGSWRMTAREEWDKAKECPASIVMWHDGTYPELLRKTIDAPPLLYCIGDTSLLSGPCLAVVGSRLCTEEGVQVATKISRELAAAGLTIVSGMAQGIDRVAHVAALTKVGKSIAVLGTGVDKVYPPHNADLYDFLKTKGLIVSEFALGTPPLAQHFPIRNRIISGLSLGVLVIEGSLQSGTLITAQQALEQNREVFAIPGPATSPSSYGCQSLVRQGAKPVFNSDDVLRELHGQLLTYKSVIRCQAVSESQQAKNGTEECHQDRDVPDADINEFCDLTDKDEIRSILHCLHSNGDCHVDTLCSKLAKSAHVVSALLTEMELAGLVKRMPGARYTATAADV